MDTEAHAAALIGLIASRTSGLDRAEYVRAAQGATRGLAEMLAAPGGTGAVSTVRSAFESAAVRSRAAADIKRWSADGIRCIALGTAEYPRQLTHIADPPLIVFVQGDNHACLAAANAIAIVGSRRADEVGCAFAFDAGKAFAKRGVVVISGLALGIDGAAHRGALASGAAGATIAVFGAGLYSVYPAMHRSLAREILAKGGLLLSQFEPEMRPFPANFLNRNRVVAGLSEGVLIVQAAERSGALATARFALESGRELMAVPGSIRDPLYGGSNRLLRTGAALVTSVEDALESFPGELRPLAAAAPAAASEWGSGEAVLLESFSGDTPLHIDTVRRRFPESATFFEDLLALELRGAVVRLPGNRVQRVR